MKKFNIKHSTFLSVAALITISASTPSFAMKIMEEELVQTTKKNQTGVREEQHSNDPLPLLKKKILQTN